MSSEIPPDSQTFNEMIGRLNRIDGESRGTVLITHLYLEYLLDWILRKMFLNPSYVLSQKFYSKLKIIDSLKILSEDIMHELWLVNKIRNQFAHRIDIESPDFENKFTELVHQMQYYVDNRNRFVNMDTYHVYYMIMPRVYAVLKSEYDQLKTPNLNTDKNNESNPDNLPVLPIKTLII